MAPTCTTRHADSFTLRQLRRRPLGGLWLNTTGHLGRRGPRLVHVDSNWPERASLSHAHGQPERAKRSSAEIGDRYMTRSTWQRSPACSAAPERPRMDVSLAQRGPWSPGRHWTNTLVGRGQTAL
eukprot:scaffold20553_cov74-Phaeocystis_antarctica.AAC.4